MEWWMKAPKTSMRTVFLPETVTVTTQPAGVSRRGGAHGRSTKTATMIYEGTVVFDDDLDGHEQHELKTKNTAITLLKL
jgi:hypothetical protein